jgi:adenylate kinase
MQQPNILITGTPGTGKTETATLASSKTGLKYINVGELVKKHECYITRDEAFDTFILDDEKILDILEDKINGGGYIIDYHAAELFPERWFDLVIVLRAETSILFDRLTERGYSDRKRTENIECEIMQVVLEEARESYDQEIVQELISNTFDDLECNVNRITEWYNAWKEQ